MATTTTVVITSYADGELLRKLLDVVISSDVDRIVLMYGGCATDTNYLEQIGDPRLFFEFETQRLGKCVALNRSLKYVKGDYVFLLSGDISISPDIFSSSVLSFTDNVGVVIPKVTPRESRGLAGIIGSVLWNLHDVELSYLSHNGFNAHGGEFLAIRTSLLSELPPIVNDDAYLCINARGKGYRVLYNDRLTVSNLIPSTLGDLFQQRIRINFGHLELMKMKMDPLVMTTLVRSDRKRFFAIMLSFIRKYPRELLVLPLACILETFSLIIASMKLRRGATYLRWPIASRDARLKD